MKRLAVLVLLLSPAACEGALLTNFANSYCQYQACSLLIPASKCFKLFCDPEGLQEGRLTLFLEVPLALVPAGGARFDLGPETGIRNPFPGYTVFQQGDAQITTNATHQRFQVNVLFSTALEPPGGEVVLFEYHIHDAASELGLGNISGNTLTDITAGVTFEPGDFVTIFNPGPPPTTTTFDHVQLQDAMFNPQVPEPATAAMVAVGLTLGLRVFRRRRIALPLKRT